MNNILNILDSWSLVGDVSQREAELVFENLDRFVEDQFEKIAEYTRSDDPETALSLMMQMTNFLSAAGKKVPKIITHYFNYFQFLGFFIWSFPKKPTEIYYFS